MQAEEMEALFLAALPGAEVKVVTVDDVHFQARIVAREFAGKPTLARHRLVYAALGERMGGEVHALSLRTLTPAEAENG
ncbi:MAG: BolA/IbaG family iron-sulfur metabolism protein [Rhodanobacteraceae bacterium]|nr:MAG: BolA/IbaG family iron-sulfur metabolism protein [Rhodanobacteraceae bacterium]